MPKRHEKNAGSIRARRVLETASLLGLAFGVGLLAGARLCATTAPVVPIPPTTRAPCVCPVTSAQTVETPPGKHSPARPRSFPTAPDPDDRPDRPALLEWVRVKATALAVCRPDGGELVRLAVTLVVAEDGHVKRVLVNGPPDRLSRVMISCLRDRIQSWTIPTDLARGPRELMFGLSI